MFDLTIYPISIVAGREQFDLPGLLVMAAPRKAARMRAQDQLLIYCALRTTPAGSAPAAGLNSAQQQEILTRLAETYFTYSGSVTASLRAVVARLNDFLLNRNLKHAKEGQTVGILNLAAIHGDSLIVAHAGPTHSFVLSRSQVQHYEDAATGPSASGPGGVRGLGLSRQATPRFYQSTLETGDLLLFCAEPPPTWTARTLANSPQLSLEHLRRRLLSDARAGLEAAVIRFQPGKGQVNYWKPGEPGAAVPGTADNGGRTAASRAVPSTPRPGLRPTRPAPAVTDTSLPDAHSLTDTSRVAAGTPPVVNPLETTSVVEDATQTADSAVPAVQESDLPRPFEAAPPEAAPASAPEALSFAASDEAGPSAEAEMTPPIAEVPPEAEPEEQPEDLDLPEAENQPKGEDLPLPRLPESGLPENLEDYLASRPAVAETPLVQPPAQPESDQRPVSAAGTPPAEIPARGSHRPVYAEPSPDTRAAMPAAPANAPAKAGAAAAGETAADRAKARPAAAAVPARRIKPVAKPRPARAPWGEGLRIRLAALWRRGRVVKGKADGAMAKASGALPKRRDAEGREQPFFNFSPSTMLAISLIVPLMVVTAAAVVYFRAGHAEQFQALYLQSQQYAQQAVQQTDPGLQRQYYEQSCSLIKKAEQFDKTDESTALKKQVCEALDGLEGYVRLAYQPALSTILPSSTNITRIVATLNDVYMLNSMDGTVLRMYRTSSGYELDPKFVCGGGQAGTAVVDPLIDLVAMPPNNEMHSTVMGIDGSGNLVYCSPSRTGFDSRPLALPDNGWGKIRAITLLNDALFVLDPSGNAVYRYDGVNGVFNAGPHFYFVTSIPQMADTTDLAVDDEFLYLLHKDGRMTLCESGGFAYAATKCTDPMPYGDTRPGFEAAPLVFPGTAFTQIMTTQPPDPSLYALDQANKAIYHLSLRRLNFQRQYRVQIDTDFPLPNSAPTAFAIAPNRRALIAFGNQVFFAPLP